jgi:antitoxin component YwqK of YwqJK toxin-antitoxin module
MPAKRASAKQHIVYHEDGSIWAKGETTNGTPTGYWEWFRKDGTKLRSGHFENGEQVGEWITYDKKGQKYKVTNIKPKKRQPALGPKPGLLHAKARP